MLVLSRGIMEIIDIGPDITVQVIRISRVNGRTVVRLAIEAPKSIAVNRREVTNNIRAGVAQGAKR